MPKKPRQCFECGAVGSVHKLHDHHVVPKSQGGTNTVPLCVTCHGKVHGKDMLKHSVLQRKGIDKAKQAGRYRGRKQGSFKTDPALALPLYQQGLNPTQIGDQLGINRRTVIRYLGDAYVGKGRSRNS